MSNASTLRKRRGVVRASITRLTDRLKDLVADTDKPATQDLAQGMARMLDAPDSEFRTHHHALVDLIDDEEALLAEQKTLDDHDDFVAELSARIQQLVNACTPSSDPPLRKIASRRLSHLKKALSSVTAAIASSEEESRDVCVSMRKNSVTARKNLLTYGTVSYPSTWRKPMNSPRYKRTWKEKSLIVHFKSRSYCVHHHTRPTLPPHLPTVRE